MAETELHAVETESSSSSPEVEIEYSEMGVYVKKPGGYKELFGELGNAYGADPAEEVRLTLGKTSAELLAGQKSGQRKIDISIHSVFQYDNYAPEGTSPSLSQLYSFLKTLPQEELERRGIINLSEEPDKDEFYMEPNGIRWLLAQYDSSRQKATSK